MMTQHDFMRHGLLLDAYVNLTASTLTSRTAIIPINPHDLLMDPKRYRSLRIEAAQSHMPGPHHMQLVQLNGTGPLNGVVVLYTVRSAGAVGASRWGYYFLAYAPNSSTVVFIESMVAGPIASYGSPPASWISAKVDFHGACLRFHSAVATRLGLAEPCNLNRQNHAIPLETPTLASVANQYSASASMGTPSDFAQKCLPGISGTKRKQVEDDGVQNISETVSYPRVKRRRHVHAQRHSRPLSTPNTYEFEQDLFGADITNPAPVDTTNVQRAVDSNARRVDALSMFGSVFRSAGPAVRCPSPPPPPPVNRRGLAASSSNASNHRSGAGVGTEEGFFRRYMRRMFSVVQQGAVFLFYIFLFYLSVRCIFINIPSAKHHQQYGNASGPNASSANTTNTTTHGPFCNMTEGLCNGKFSM